MTKRNRQKHRQGSAWTMEGVVHRGDRVIELSDSRRLTEDTVVFGQYEHAMKEILLELETVLKISWHQPYKLDLSNYEIYPPDFGLPHFVGGKQIIIELHNADGDYFQKMSRLRKNFGDKFYYILVSSSAAGPAETYKEIGRDKEHGNCVDELWIMPRIPIRGKEQVIDLEAYDAWKVMIREGLFDLINNRADKIVDWEIAAELINIKRVA